MTFYFAKPLMFTALFALAACGSSGSSGSGSDEPTSGTNGLDYGFAGQELSDAEGTEVTMSRASFQAGGTPEISPATITVNANFFDGGTANLDGTIEIFSQIVTITNGVGTLSSGEEVRLTYEPNRSGTYAAAIDATVSSASDINGEGVYVMGFESDPDAISARTSGSVTYSGDFQATGSVGGANTQTEYEGSITVLVDFGDDDADFTLGGTLDGSTPVDLGATELDIAGNGISGELDCTLGCSGVDGSSTVDATFYGPDADELGGVLAIDVNVTGVGTYEGVGTFVLID